MNAFLQMQCEDLKFSVEEQHPLTIHKTLESATCAPSYLHGQLL